VSAALGSHPRRSHTILWEWQGKWALWPFCPTTEESLKNALITCLENKLKSSDAANESLRQSLMQINSEKLNGLLSVEQSLSNQFK
jgi:hypothetical protein